MDENLWTKTGWTKMNWMKSRSTRNRIPTNIAKHKKKVFLEKNKVIEKKYSKKSGPKIEILKSISENIRSDMNNWNIVDFFHTDDVCDNLKLLFVLFIYSN